MSLFKRLRDILPSRQREAEAPRPVLLVTDSTADLPPALASELEITVIPLRVIFGERSYRDGVDLSSEEFFRRLSESGELPKTSQPSTGEFIEAYERLAARTNRILSVHLSSKFSGTVETARRAAQSLIGRCTIEVVDSGTVSMAMGFGVIAAARAAREGADLETCAAIARSVLRRQRLAVTLDTLEYLRRGGRIGRAQAFLGGLLHIKPILTIRNGEAQALSRARTRRKALDEVLHVCLDHGRIIEAAVMHSTSEDDARFLAGELGRRCPGVPVHTGVIGPVIGVHGGPGLVGLAVVLAEQEGALP